MGCDIHWFVEVEQFYLDGNQHKKHWVAERVPREYVEGMHDGDIWMDIFEELPPDVNEPHYALYRQYRWPIWRNYRLFDALNGVRARAEHEVSNIIGKKRGFDGDPYGNDCEWPETATDTSLKCGWDDDGHSYCWAYLYELQDERIAQAGGDEYVHLIKMMGGLHEDPAKVRALWFYDN